MENKPNYYAIIPAEVRYADIKANAKLLYGEITALSNKEGYCWASNDYFAKLYGVSTNSISSWVKALYVAGFVDIKVDKAKGNLRYITIKVKLDSHQEKLQTYTRKVVDPYTRKVVHNNTSVNSTYNKDMNYVKKGNTENRGKESKAKEKIRETLKVGGLRALKNA